MPTVISLKRFSVICCFHLANVAYIFPNGDISSEDKPLIRMTVDEVIEWVDLHWGGKKALNYGNKEDYNSVFQYREILSRFIKVTLSVSVH